MDLDGAMQPCRAKASTSRSFGFRPNAWIEMPLPVRPRLTASAAAWLSARRACRTGVMNTDRHWVPTAALAATPVTLGDPTVVAGVSVTHLRYPVLRR